MILSSYAGAIGLPQFMPSSIIKYGYDFDGDNMVDLNNSTKDVLASIANYLTKKVGNTMVMWLTILINLKIYRLAI